MVTSKSEWLMAQHPAQADAVHLQDEIEAALTPLIDLSVLGFVGRAQKLGAHHGSDRK